jgi:futalosine hydrolase
MDLVLVPTFVEAGLLLGRAANVQMDELPFGKPVRVKLGAADVRLAVCGFGLPSAGVGACLALGSLESLPERVLLVGTAGAIDVGRAPIGAAVVADGVQCVDVGLPVGRGGALTVELPGLSDWPDFLPLNLPESIRQSAKSGEIGHGTFVSVAAPSGSVEQAAAKGRLTRNAIAEEMEGYSVALACATWNVPLSIIRGISNEAGNRDKTTWRLVEAMDAVKQLLTLAVN